MSIQDVANKVFKQYARHSGPGENMDGLAASMARWTNESFEDCLKAMNITMKASEKARNNENNNLKTSEDIIDEV